MVLKQEYLNISGTFPRAIDFPMLQVNNKNYEISHFKPFVIAKDVTAGEFKYPRLTYES